MGRGRTYLRGEKARNRAFSLPESLIEKIEAEAAEETGRNATELAVRLFEAYFKAKEGKSAEVFGVELKRK